jgi:purine nucleoside permease
MSWMRVTRPPIGQQAMFRYAGISLTRGPSRPTRSELHTLNRNLVDWAFLLTRGTAGRGNYMMSAMEDTRTLQALTFLSAAARVDLNRVLVLRTVSNYDREGPGSTAAESLKALVKRAYAAYMPALEAAERTGDRVVDVWSHTGWNARLIFQSRFYDRNHRA